MINFVLDASALLALILHEPGGDIEKLLDQAAISAVNLAEVRTKLIDLQKLDEEFADGILRKLIRVEPFTEDQAIATANLRNETRHLGLSLGDRACIALALSLKATVYTADRTWTKLKLPSKIHSIR
jgi:PIN domain nuclease of toxin-antitoxin system